METTTIEKTKEDLEISRELRQFHGTENYYRHFGKVLYTDGIQFMAVRCKAYWLLDIVATAQPTVDRAPFQLWQVKVSNGKGVVTCREDSNQPEIFRQELITTDFPMSDFEFYCCDNIILLKSEY